MCYFLLLCFFDGMGTASYLTYSKCLLVKAIISILNVFKNRVMAYVWDDNEVKGMILMNE